MRLRLAVLLLLAPGLAHAESKMRVAVLSHAPGVPKAAELADDVSSSLVAQEFAVLSRKRLLDHLVAVAGGSADPLADLRSRIAQADKQYLDLDLDGAEATLKGAESALAAQLSDPEAIVVLREILERRALVMLTLGRTDPATEKLNQLYVLDPDYQPDARLLSPQFAPAFEKARAATSSATRGTLMVTTAPAGGDVYVDGRWAGAAPVTLELRAGQHVVQARHAEAAPGGAIVTVDANARSEFPFRLAAQSGEERKKARVREVMTNTLPGPRAKIGEEIRALTGASAVVVVVTRATSDGPRAHAEVFRADQPGFAAKTAELAPAGSSIAKETAKLLEAPAQIGGEIAPPRFATRKTVRNPFLAGVSFGPRIYYGTGWGRVSGLNRSAAYLGGVAAFRLEEERSSVIDLVASAGISTANGCSTATTPCTKMSVATLAVDVAPRLVVPLGNRLQWYAQVGVGATNSEVRVFSPGVPMRSDAVLAVSVHMGSGVTIIAHRRFLVSLDGKLGVADAPSSTLEDLTGVKRLNVGGTSLVLTLGTRL